MFKKQILALLISIAMITFGCEEPKKADVDSCEETPVAGEVVAGTEELVDMGPVAGVDVPVPVAGTEVPVAGEEPEAGEEVVVDAGTETDPVAGEEVVVDAGTETDPVAGEEAPTAGTEEPVAGEEEPVLPG